MSDCNPCGNPRTVIHPPPATALLPGQRAAIYQELAHLYRTPSWEQVQGALDHVLLKYPKFLLDNKDAHFHPVKELERHEKESYRLGLESFQAEYVRLFVNTREGVLAPPYASENEPPDHISYELEFLSFLCAMEQEALDQGRQEDADGLRKAQADFLCNLLIPWANRFCDRIVENSNLAYYRLVGAFTKGFLAHESALVEGKPSK